MGLKSAVLKPIAKLISAKINRDVANATDDQKSIMLHNCRTAKDTLYGRDHKLSGVSTYDQFKERVHVHDYEGLRSYIDKVIDGEKDILWPGTPKYFAKTSGTTSGTKYIPITKESLPNHFGSARNMIFHYYAQTSHGSFFDGKLMFLSGSPVLEEISGIKTGRLSGISNHVVPPWLKKNQVPSYETNCINDWETKVEKIALETIGKDLRLISGIPPWVQMYYECILDMTGKKDILEVFPNLSMYIYGGVNFEPYRNKLESLQGGKIASLETYPASEGFIAFQDTPDFRGLLLNTNYGIFFEFIPVEEYYDPNPTRIALQDVELGRQYAVILNSNAGLWGYSIGDTVEFVSLNPYRIVVSGRIKHYISAFGEHVIGKEVEQAVLKALEIAGGSIIEFTVAPQVNPEGGTLPYHEWLISFGEEPKDMNLFLQVLDTEMQKQNVYYKDLIEGKILRPLVVTRLNTNAFRDYMKSQGKLGGQNKVPRLSNDRKIAEALYAFL